MRWLPALLCAAAALAAGHAAPSPADAPGVDVSEDDVFTLVHRVHTPGGAAPAWAPRAHLKLLADDPEKAQALYRRVAGESEWQSLLASASASASAPASTPGTPAPPNSLYQIALVPGAWESHVDVDSFPSAPVSSTKLVRRLRRPPLFLRCAVLLRSVLHTSQAKAGNADKDLSADSAR